MSYFDKMSSFIFFFLLYLKASFILLRIYLDVIGFRKQLWKICYTFYFVLNGVYQLYHLSTKNVIKRIDHFKFLILFFKHFFKAKRYTVLNIVWMGSLLLCFSLMNNMQIRCKLFLKTPFSSQYLIYNVLYSKFHLLF